MGSLSQREIVEVFHLEFVRMLATSTQKAHYAIKGGCNLRFFFRSVRYSEDLDLDVAIAAKETLERQVDGIFESPAFARLLKARGVRVAERSKPKQTATVRRWKVTLESRERALPLNTKIEFSRRRADDEAALDPIDPSLLDRYGLPRLNARHYPLQAAIRQKVGALVGRAEAQARDVFDLDLLIGDARPAELRELRKSADAAIARTMELSYDQFASQVIAYLMPEHAALYESRDTWESMQLRVVEFLEAVAR